MDAKQIRENMVKGKFTHSFVDGKYFIGCGETYFLTHIFPHNRLPEQQECTAAAIVLAVNATWGAGIDPAKVGEAVKMLEGLANEFKLSEVERNTIQQLLNSLKIK